MSKSPQQLLERATNQVFQKSKWGFLDIAEAQALYECLELLKNRGLGFRYEEPQLLPSTSHLCSAYQTHLFFLTFSGENNRGLIWIGKKSISYTENPGHLSSNESPETVTGTNEAKVAKIPRFRDTEWIETVMSAMMQQAIECYGSKAYLSKRAPEAEKIAPK